MIYFTMDDYRSLTGTANLGYASFGRGKDKAKRKKRGAGFYAGVGAAGLLGAGGLAAGIRYGGAQLNKGKQEAIYYSLAKDVANRYSKPVYESYALRNAGKDKYGPSLEPAMRSADVKRKGAKSVFGRDVERLKGLGERGKRSFNRGVESFRQGKGLDKIKDLYKSGSVGKAGLIGAGALGAGALGYGAYRLLRNQKDN